MVNMSEPLSILSQPSVLPAEEVMVYTEHDKTEYGEIRKAESKQEKYNMIMKLHSEGVSIKKIEKIVGINNAKVSYWIRFGFEQGTEKYNEYHRKYDRKYVKNPEKKKERQRKWYEANLEKVKEQHRLWYLKNAEKIKEQQRLRALKNAEKAKERKLDREKSKEQQRLWRLDNPEKVKEAHRMIGWKRMGIDPIHARQLHLSTDICEICGDPVYGSVKVVDHNHKTEKLRGILCSNCNLAIGLMREKPRKIQNAINYLNKYKIWSVENEKERNKILNLENILKNSLSFRKHKRYDNWERMGVDPIQSQLLFYSTSKCEICGKRITADIKRLDHDHKNNQLRGILCHNCNIAIGLMHDNTTTFQNTINYLKKYNKRRRLKSKLLNKELKINIFG